MSDLPASWEQKKLGEIAFVTKLAGFEFTKYVKYSDTGEIPVIRAQNVTKSGFQDGNFHYVSREILESLPRSRVRGGEILMVFVGSVGNVGLVPEGKDYFLGPNVAKIKIEDEQVFNKFVLYFLMSEEGKTSIGSFSKSTTQSSISMGNIRDILAPIPPLDEQKRIAEKLDSLLTRVDSCERHLERVPQILKRFRQSVLAAATSGRLTEDWRNERGINIENWKPSKVSDVCEVVRGASPRPAGDPKYFGGQGAIPWITVGEITKDNSKFLTSVSSYVTEEGKNKSRYIEPDNLLLTNSGATLGVPKITKIGGCINDGSVALLGLSEPLKSYLYYVLLSKTESLRNINQGAAQPNLNTTIVKAIEFELPDETEQAEIVRRVESLFAYAERLEARYLSASERVARLTPSLLAKGFKGEL